MNCADLRTHGPGPRPVLVGAPYRTGCPPMAGGLPGGSRADHERTGSGLSSRSFDDRNGAGGGCHLREPDIGLVNAAVPRCCLDPEDGADDVAIFLLLRMRKQFVGEALFLAGPGTVADEPPVVHY